MVYCEHCQRYHWPIAYYKKWVERWSKMNGVVRWQEVIDTHAGPAVEKQRKEDRDPLGRDTRRPGRPKGSRRATPPPGH